MCSAPLHRRTEGIPLRRSRRRRQCTDSFIQALSCKPAREVTRWHAYASHTVCRGPRGCPTCQRRKGRQASRTVRPSYLPRRAQRPHNMWSGNKGRKTLPRGAPARGRQVHRRPARRRRATSLPKPPRIRNTTRGIPADPRTHGRPQSRTSGRRFGWRSHRGVLGPHRGARHGPVRSVWGNGRP